MPDESRPDPVLRAVGSWQPARVLMTANRLGVFAVLGEEALPAEEVAQRCQAHPRSTALLLNACVALGFLRKDGDRYANSPEALETLIPGKPTYIGDRIKHDEWLYDIWAHLERAVRTNRPVRDLAQPRSGAETWREFSLAMHNLAMRTGPLLADTLDLSGRRQLLDCGGGVGTHAMFLVQRYPGLRAIVFDLPETIELAKEIIEQSGLADRITARGGNYFADDLGQSHDVVLLSSVLHSMPPEACRALLEKCHRSLVSGGWIVVHEILIDPDGTSPPRAALFSLNMLVNTGEGRSYSGEEIMRLMKETGFAPLEVKALPSPAYTSLVIGEKP
ncbi:MAG: methyltransferase domain-containing protein [Dehalococcoidia bacterium]|nr:MAG: methyltransferase domain-containing protein [Dehalococcoidia bacterium]